MIAARHRRRRLAVGIDELASGMGEAEGKRDRILAGARADQRLVGVIAVHLDGATVTGELSTRLIVPASARMDVDDGRMRWTQPWPVIAGMRPELGDTYPSSSFLQNRHAGLVAEDPGLSVDIGQQALVERAHPPGDLAHPAACGRTIEDNALAGQHLDLAIERDRPGKARGGDPGQRRGRDHRAGDRALRRRRLHDAFPAVAAAIERPHRADDPDDRGNPVECLTGILTDPVQRAAAARAVEIVGKDELLDALEMGGQGLLPPLAAPTPGQQIDGRGVIVIGGGDRHLGQIA